MISLRFSIGVGSFVTLAFTSNTGQDQNLEFLPHLESLHCLSNESCEMIVTIFTGFKYRLASGTVDVVFPPLC